MTVTGREFINRFEQFCPLGLAEEGDPCGLHIGTLEKPIKRVMMTLDVRPEVVQEAIEKKVDLLIAKHPPIFRAIPRLLEEDPQVKMYMDLIKHNIAVYAAHTNMDIMWGGLNDWFCEELNLTVDTYLKQTHTIPYKKVIFYVPTAHSDVVLREIERIGADDSLSISEVHSTFPIKKESDCIEKAYSPEHRLEQRIEVTCLETDETAIVSAIRNIYSYDQITYDSILLDNDPVSYGIGRVGHYEKPISLDELIRKIKTVFHLEGLKLIQPNPPVKMVQTIAICGGTGGNFYPEALKQKADVYITGDVYYHTAHDMQTNGLTVIDPGHHIEELCIPKFVEEMVKWTQEKDWPIEIFGSTTNTNPFKFR